MKKKVFFVISSFSAGGAERVFWLISQAFNKDRFDVVVVVLSLANSNFNLDLPELRIVNLNTIKASSSFSSLFRLIRKEKPFAIYSTGGEINFLVSIVSLFLPVAHLIARGTNIPEERYKYYGLKSKLISKLTTLSFRNFNYIVCQSREMMDSWASRSVIQTNRLVLIPNPVVKSKDVKTISTQQAECNLIIVARLSSVKGHGRLLNIFKELPRNYTLTIAGGEGGLKGYIEERIIDLQLKDRVKMIGEISDVCNEIRKHTLFVLSSFTEGFPNVVLEALSVGVPVVTFKVGGVSDFIVDDFNGYIVEQGDEMSFKECIIKACNRSWDHGLIASDIHDRFSIDKVVEKYEQLIAD